MSSEELHVSNYSSNNIDPTVIINQPPANKKKPSETELMLKEEDSESGSSEESLSYSPKFGQRQYSQRGTLLKKPVKMPDSMGDIMEELDNKKQPNEL